jgi:hypothetical protein
LADSAEPEKVDRFGASKTGIMRQRYKLIGKGAAPMTES